jgi:AraC-like DNA-binding protein
MIANLDGIHETVNYRNDIEICLYNNDEAEDYPPHWHIPFELIMPVKNSYHVRCSEEDYFIREGDVLIICPGVIHELFAPESGERMIFQSSLSFGVFHELDALSSIISPAILITPEEYPQIHAQIRGLMLQIREEYANGLPYSGTLIYSHFLQILAEIGQNHVENIQFETDTSRKRRKEYADKFLFVTQYISEHFAENLTLEQVASLSGFSKYHFTRLFRQYAGVSFYKYLNQKRIAHAKRLLLNPRLSVTEVALQSGFTSISAFIRMFRLANNCTPTEFRKMYN